MATSGIMSRRPRRPIPARPGPCLVHWFCLLCLAAYGAPTRLSFVNCIGWSGPRIGMKQVGQRFSRQREDLRNEIPGENPELEARILTSRIKESRSPQELIDILDGVVDCDFFNFIHASAAYTKLAALKKRLQPTDWDGPVIARLHGRVEDMLLHDMLGARQTANVMHSVAKLSDRFRIPHKLLAALVKSVHTNAQDMVPQALSNCMLACAQLKEVAPAVLEAVPAIVAQIIRKAKDMVPQALSNCLWACGQLQKVAPSVLKAVPAIVTQIAGNAKGMKPQELSNCLWACEQGMLKEDAPEVLKIVFPLAAEVKLKINDMKPQEMSNTLEALVPLKELVPEVARLSVDIVRSAATRFNRLLPSLRGKDLSINVPVAVWACAALGMYHEQLLLSVAQHLGFQNKLSMLPRFSLCALAWSYQVLGAEDEFEDLKELLKSVAASRGFSEADIESTKLGHLKWNHAKLGERGPVRG